MITPHTHIVSVCAKFNGTYYNDIIKISLHKSPVDIKTRAAAECKQILAMKPGAPKLSFIAQILEINANGTFKNVE